ITLVLSDCVGDTGRVVSFEPMPSVYHRLCENVALNGFTNVTTVPAGVSDAPGSAVLALHPATRMDGRPGASHEVTLVTLDGYITQHGVEQVDLLKIDIDGGEARVLRGATQTLARFRPTVVIETGVDVIDEAERIIGLLSGLGYRFYDDTGERRLDHPLDTIRSLAAGTTMNLV